MTSNAMSLFDVDPNSSELGSAAGLWALMRIPGVGPATALKLAGACSSWERLSENPKDALAQANATGRVNPHVVANFAMNPGQPPAMDAEVRLVGYFDPDYPDPLQGIASPPAVLWVKGTMPAEKTAAVVGTRSPTKEGLDRVRKMVEVLVSAGYGIVSGLAIGVDTAAHEAALEYGGQTWAYLGSGVDTPSPKENLDLAQRIIDAGGGLLAEVDPGTESSSGTLLRRNRLQSGTSNLAIIAQAGLPSGTLHTARFAIEQDRNLIVVQPPVKEADHSSWAGNRALCDPDGCDPALLNAEGTLAKRIAARKPTADHVLTSAAALSDLLE